MSSSPAGDQEGEEDRVPPPSSARRGPGRDEIALVVLAFAASRLLYREAGVWFNTQTLTFYWQFLDPELLRSRLAESLWHLHSQPPLFNLFLGAVSKLPPAWQRPAFQGAFLALGLGLGLALLFLLARLGAGRAWRLGLTLFFLLSPACALYENQLFYTYPLTAALAAAGLALHRFLASGRTADGLAFFALLAAACLTHSLFHLAWPVLVLLALAALLPRRRRRLALAALPLLLPALWYARSWALFGSFSASTWLGMSFAQTATRLTPPPERVRLARSDPSLAILEVPPFSPLDAYAGRLPLPPATGIPALDRPVKSTGAPNYNHLAYVGISRAYLAAARAWIARFPGRYLRSVGAAHTIYFRSAADNKWLGENRRRLGRFAHAWDLVLAGQWRPFDNRLGPGAVAWWWVLLLPLTLALAVRRLRRAARAGPPGAAELTAIYLMLTVLWVAAAGNWLELGENDRFRFVTDPLMLALLGWAAGTRRAAASAPGRG